PMSDPGPRPVAVLPPNAPPLPRGLVGAPPGTHHEASGSRYPGSTHVVRSVRTHSPAGTSTGQVTGAVERRPCTLPLAARASATDSPTTQVPSARRIATSASWGARSSAKPPRPSATAGPTSWATPPSTVALASARGETSTGVTRDPGVAGESAA